MKEIPATTGGSPRTPILPHPVPGRDRNAHSERLVAPRMRQCILVTDLAELRVPVAMRPTAERIIALTDAGVR